MHIYLVFLISISVIISNALSISLLVFIALDPYSSVQGVDYCIFSLALSDLLAGIIITPLSIASLITNNLWIVEDGLCKILGYLSYSFWAINVTTLFWLSVDRYSYITDTKYCTYKIRTKVRCICNILLSWLMSAMYCLAPIIVHKEAAHYAQQTSSICTMNWISLEGYYMTVTCITILPCFLATIINFCRIFYWRLKYNSGWFKIQLKAATVEYLLEPNHRMSLVLVLVFWCSWLPYIFHIFQGKFLGPRAPSFLDIWLGFSQAIWKLPIMILFCPRYRSYFAVLLHIEANCFSNYREILSKIRLCHRKNILDSNRHNQIYYNEIELYM